MALRLTRRRGERVTIGADVVVTIEQIDGYQVRLSIDAPRDIRVMRTELLERDARAAAGLVHPTERSS